ncbi:MAG: Uma2 family endonuclease [Paracoccaceae bacterium]|nr:Uma2 family endonuclease [Paracoccaceae bacterium]
MTTTLDEHHIIGPLGSDFWRIRVSPELVPALAREFDWNRLGRRVMIDTREGIISWMNPSSSHVGHASASEKVIPLAAAILKLHVQDMRDLRWKGPDGPEKVWLEADAAFYIGKNAETWISLFRKGGQEAVEAFEAKTPPDLVVEVEVTHFDRKKPQLYSEIGVRELWRVNARKANERVQVEILDLQAIGGLRQVDKSPVLGDLDATILPKAFWLARSRDYKGLKDLLVENLVPATNSEPEPESSPPSPSM